ncbi:MAG: hypothetical protein OXT07_05870 [bacterium]|nr:hypothetical protein [bacterium]
MPSIRSLICSRPASSEIERVLGADSRVAECCVVGRPDDRLG